MPQPCIVISRRQFTIDHESLAVPGTLLTDLTMKPLSGFELANSVLTIDKIFITLLL